ncbi:multiple epidermal growth factor-like domains protein 10 [Saccostrea cucullata]|uniref:multiple epidermal growth factor-like domains protein 10 n=1 Tax=Saccostrea cuccullata TaxID=36930 RepID=UPI002ED4BFF8
MKHFASIIETFIVLSAPIFLCSCSTETPKCEKGFKNCCANYKWNNETQQCEKCLPGYSGVNCSQSCPFPFFGEGCQERCDCDNNTCDVSTDCKNVTTDGQTFPFASNATENILIGISTISKTENSTFVDVRRGTSSSINELLLILIETLGCVDLLLIFAHFFVYIYDRRNRTDMNSIDTTVNYHRTNTMYENIDINFPSTSNL